MGKIPLSSLSAALRKEGQRLQRAVSRAQADAARKGVAVVRRRVPKASRELEQSIEAQGNRIVATAPYAAIVDQGSRPHFPPLEPIVAWVEEKGIATGPDARSVAFAIAKKISEEGTEPTFFMRSALPEVQKLFDAAFKRLAQSQK